MSRGLPPIELDLPEPAPTQSSPPKAPSLQPPSEQVAQPVSQQPGNHPPRSGEARGSLTPPINVDAGQRCSAHGLWTDTQGLCPRCAGRKAPSAFWVYVAIGVTMTLIAMLFVAKKTSEALHEYTAEKRGRAHEEGVGGRERVVVYTTSTCHVCRSAKSWMQANHVAYTERNIDDDDAAQREYARLNSRAVPTFVIDGETMIGFNPKRIQTALSKPPPQTPQ